MQFDYGFVDRTKAGPARCSFLAADKSSLAGAGGHALFAFALA
jgi:hypothetical protein